MLRPIVRTCTVAAVPGLQTLSIHITEPYDAIKK